MTGVPCFVTQDLNRYMEDLDKYDLSCEDRYESAHKSCMKRDPEYRRMYEVLKDLEARGHSDWTVAYNIRDEIKDRLDAEREAIADDASSDAYNRSTLYL